MTDDSYYDIIIAIRTSAYYAVAPFIGTLLSLIIFRELPNGMFFVALGLMIIGAWLCASDTPIFRKKRKDGARTPTVFENTERFYKTDRDYKIKYARLDG